MTKEEGALVAKCENGESGLVLGLDREGELFLAERDGAWRRVDFNGMYAGYYPKCRFTAIAFGGGSFLGAALDEEGRPHLFSSLLGGVWEETPLWDFQGKRRGEGRILRILWEEEDGQAYLVCENGDLITVPDCPRCIRIRRVTEGEVEVEDGWLEGRDVALQCRDGSVWKVPASAARQYRASAEYLAERFAHAPGYLVDFRGEQFREVEEDLFRKLPEILKEVLTVESDRNACGDAEIRRKACPDNNHAGPSRYLSLEYREFKEWLNGVPKERLVAFLCASGVLAEEAAVYARRLGWRKAYYLKL